MLGILFAFLFLICVFKFVGILLMMCGKVMGAVFSMLGFIISLAVGVLLFGLFGSFFHDPFGNCSCVAVSADHLIIKRECLC